MLKDIIITFCPLFRNKLEDSTTPRLNIVAILTENGNIKPDDA